MPDIKRPVLPAVPAKDERPCVVDWLKTFSFSQGDKLGDPIKINFRFSFITAEGEVCPKANEVSVEHTVTFSDFIASPDGPALAELLYKVCRDIGLATNKLEPA